MLRDEAVEQIKFWLNAAEELEPAILRELKLAQSELEKRALLPWFLVSEVTYIDLTPGEERVPVPGDFLREYEEEGAIWRQIAGRNFPMRKAQRGLHFFHPQNLETGPTEFYYSLDGGYFRVYPTPVVNDTIGMLYYQQAGALTENVENEWLREAAELLMSKAALKMATVLRNTEARRFLFDLYLEANRVLDLAIIARREARQTHTNWENNGR